MSKSGLQKQVLALYRRALRIPPTKPASARPDFSLFIRYTFRETAASVGPTNVGAIEHLMRVGTRQIEMLEGKSVRSVGVTEEMRRWEGKRLRF